MSGLGFIAEEEPPSGPGDQKQISKAVVRLSETEQKVEKEHWMKARFMLEVFVSLNPEADIFFNLFHIVLAFSFWMPAGGVNMLKKFKNQNPKLCIVVAGGC